jgi:hypothetical protein
MCYYLALRVAQPIVGEPFLLSAPSEWIKCSGPAHRQPWSSKASIKKESTLNLQPRGLGAQWLLFWEYERITQIPLRSLPWFKPKEMNMSEL